MPTLMKQLYSVFVTTLFIQQSLSYAYITNTNVPRHSFLVPASSSRANHGFVTAATTTTSTTLSSSSSSSSSSNDDTTSSLSTSNISRQSLVVPETKGIRRARELVRSLIEDDECYTTESGAIAFATVCAINCVYEDRYEGQPIIGKIAIQQHLLQRVQQRSSSNGCSIRIDKISDGNTACGYAWTWTCKNNQEEGLRGTTFVELNSMGEIQFVCEIPEPIYKPNDTTKDLLKFVTADAVRKQPRPYTIKYPTTANEIVKYLFIDLQNAADRTAGLSYFDSNIYYRDFNYDEQFIGIDAVKQFIQDFDFPGIEFRPLRFDDGIDSTCFTWEVVINDAPETIKGISFYELNPITKKIIYVRDIPESAIKPPPLGAIARFINPKLGVFTSVPIGSRPGGM